MKNLLVGLLMFVSVVAFAQEIPKGSWQCEPSAPEFKEDAGRGHWEVSQLKVLWEDESDLEASYGMDGTVTNMVFRTMGEKKDIFSFPPTKEFEKFSALEGWKKFAEQARARCKFLTEFTYVDTTPYEFVGKSRVLQGWEFGRGQEHLVFKDGDRLVVISLYDWEGTEPKKGEKVFVGRHKDHQVFFPVEKIGEKYLIEPRTAEALAQLDRRQEEVLAEPKEAPIPTVPPLVVEGKVLEK